MQSRTRNNTPKTCEQANDLDVGEGNSNHATNTTNLDRVQSFGNIAGEDDVDGLQPTSDVLLVLRCSRPYVVLKMATSLDGRVA